MGEGYFNAREAVPFSTSAVMERMEPLHLMVVGDDANIREVCRTVAESGGMKASDVGTAEEVR
jgi:hypothetical protein